MTSSVHVVCAYVSYEDTKVVGVYSTADTAEEAVDRFERAIEEGDREKAPLSKSGERSGLGGELHYDGFYVEEWEVADDE